MQKIKTYIIAHKIISAIVAIVVVFVGYKVVESFKSTATQTSYVLGTVQTGTIIQTVAESGEVSASNSINLSPQASGNVTYIGVTNGQQVKQGQLIAEIDPTAALKTVRDAQASLESAQLSLEKLEEPTATSTMLQSQDSLAQAQQSVQNDQANLTADYGSGFNTVVNAFSDLPNSMADLQSILYSYNSGLGGSLQWNIDFYTNTILQYDKTLEATNLRDTTNTDYQTALAAYNQTFADYQAASRTSATSTIAALITETYNTAQDIADATKSATDLIQLYTDTLDGLSLKPASVSATQLSTLEGSTGLLNGHLSDLLNATNSLNNDQEAIANANLSVAQSSASLSQLQGGPDPLSIQSSQLSVQQAENSLADAKSDLADYYVYAPFDGIISKVGVIVGDPAGSGTTVATLLTNQQIATLSVNEVDAAKIQLGQNATLTFDAVPGLSIAGTVSEIDTQGTVTQGVVTYNVEIAFATQDPRVKPGMTVDAAIITNTAENVLMVPNSAIKTVGTSSYVQVFDPALATSTSASATSAASTGVVSAVPPQNVPVVTGLANDTDTQITSGLTDGEQIVTRTVTSSATAVKSTATTATSLLGGGGAAGGAASRTFTRG